MGLLVSEPDAGSAQGNYEELKTNWYGFYCQAIASGVDPRDFGSYTYSQIVAMIDSHKLKRYNDMYFNVSNIVSQMDDDSVRNSLSGGGGGNALRGKLVQKMMRPYTPSFLLPEFFEIQSSSPIPNLSPKTAEGIMQAIENKMVPHMHWLAIKPIWHRILATANHYSGK